MRNSLVEIKRAIQVHRKVEPEYRLELGRKREAMVNKALRELKDRGLIRGFVATGNLSWADIVNGVDFYIVYVSNRYKVCSLSVTGRGWVEIKKRQHPDNQVICVGLEETQKSVENKILKAIAARERNWKS